MLANDQILVMIRMVRDGIVCGTESDELCREIAEVFGLLDRDDCFPEWLSRIVEGEQRDHENKEGFWYAE